MQPFPVAIVTCLDLADSTNLLSGGVATMATAFVWFDRAGMMLSSATSHPIKLYSWEDGEQLRSCKSCDFEA
jgi:hypothetical protein